MSQASVCPGDLVSSCGGAVVFSIGRDVIDQLAEWSVSAPPGA